MFVLYYFLVLILWLIALLPFKILYFISDILYLILFYVFKYRKSIVISNLHNSFPKKSSDEIKKLTKQYYKNLCDLIIEIVKLNTITRKQLLKRIRFNNYEIIDEYFDKEKSIIAAIGHCGNWEWVSMVMAMIGKYKVYGIVKPLNNKFFEKYLVRLRSKFNKDNLISFQETFREMIKNKNNLTIYIFAADQTPTKNEINYWSHFLNQETPVYLGTEKTAKYLDFVVLFMDIQRYKRGYYEVSISTITDKPKQTKEYEITEGHIHKLEEAIKKNPDNWLWSHRRWKHKKE